MFSPAPAARVASLASIQKGLSGSPAPPMDGAELRPEFWLVAQQHWVGGIKSGCGSFESFRA